MVYAQRTKDPNALKMVEKTLDSMAKGGIYDHIAGGFHRYATDTKWLIPHFEKMLYDQALISQTYLHAYQITKNQKYANTAKEIFDYVLNEMTDPKGGFYAAEDADSEGKEGTFYLWDKDQIESLLNEDESKIFNAHFSVTETGNFEHNKTILNVTATIEQLQKDFKKDRNEIENILGQAKTKIYKARSKRIRPHRDDKVITAWNALMISSLANGGTILKEKKYIKAAEKAANFILDTLYKNDRLMRYYRNGKAIELAFLDDYAFTIIALLDLYQATFDAAWLEKAKKLSDQMIELYADQQNGGFYLTGTDNEKLITRTKPYFDGALPSGNSAAALALLKMSRITMDNSTADLANKAIQANSKLLEQSPGYSPAMLIALNFLLGPTQEIVIAGNADAKDAIEMLNITREKYMPNAIILFHPQVSAKSIRKIAPFIKNQTAFNNKATAYVCENYVCKKPVDNLEDLAKLLNEIARTKADVSK